jgi:hypothetical protein
MALVPLLGGLGRRPQPAPTMSVLFPRWFDLVEHIEDVYFVYSLISTCYEASLLDFRAHPKFIADSVRRAKADLQLLGITATRESSDSIDEKQRDRAIAEMEWLLDIFRHMEHAEIDQIARESLRADAARIRLFAIPIALARSLPVSPSLLIELAATPSNRHRLWSILETCDRLELFPNQYRTYAHLAEANMVRWLEFPMEMGKPPAEIKPLTVLRHSQRDGTEWESHYFKFRDPETYNGHWLVGFAGTYDTAKEPYLRGAGTLSKFNELDSKTLDEHIADYQPRLR